MGSHNLEVLRQGFWGSITGGWYYDPHQNISSNTIHLYLWLFLLCLPLSLFLGSDNSVSVWIIYLVVIGLTFSVIKTINYRMHLMFDVGELPKSETDGSEEEGKDQSDLEGNEDEPAAQTSGVHLQVQHIDETLDGIELEELNSNRRSVTPPIGCSSCNSVNRDIEKPGEEFGLPGSIKADIHHQKDAYSSDDTLLKALNTLDTIEKELCLDSPPSSEMSKDDERQDKREKMQTTSFINSNSSVPSTSRSLSMSPKSEHSKKLKTKNSIVERTRSNSSVEPYISTPSEDDDSERYSELLDVLLDNTSLRCTTSTSHGSKKQTKKELELTEKTEPLLQFAKWSELMSDEEYLETINSYRNRKPHSSHKMSSSSDTGAGDTSTVSSISSKEFSQISENDDFSSLENSSMFQPLSWLTHNSEDGRRPRRTVSVDSNKRKTRNKEDTNMGKSNSDDVPCRSSSLSSSPTITTKDTCSSNSDQSDTCLLRRRLPSDSSITTIIITEEKNSQLVPSPMKTEDEEGTTIAMETDAFLKSDARTWIAQATDTFSLFDSETDHHQEIGSPMGAVEIPRTQSDVAGGHSRDRSCEGAIPKQRIINATPSDFVVGDDTDPDSMAAVAGSNSSRLLTKIFQSVRRDILTQDTNSELEINMPRRRRMALYRSATSADPRRHRIRRRRRHDSGPDHARETRVVDLRKSISPPVAFSHQEGSNYMATSHDDTAQGSVHCFQDELGNWLTYTFDDSGNGEASRLESERPSDLSPAWSKSIQSTEMDKDSVYSESSAPFVLELPKRVSYDDIPAMMSENFMNGHEHSIFINEVLNFNSFPNDPSRLPKHQERKKVIHNYRFWILPWKSFRVKSDRLAFQALLDRNCTIIESIFAIVLAILVALVGFGVLTGEFFEDFWIFWFCFVIASCQYSLIKSVQPDAASPMHGHNQIIAYSRPFYFCVCCSLVLFLQYCTTHFDSDQKALSFYGIPFASLRTFTIARDALVVFVLLFPLIFLLGLLPQCNTLAMYLLETIDIHIFGGNATTGVGAASYAVARSVGAVLILCGFAYGAFVSDKAETSVFFSVFCALLVPISYHLSRSACNPDVLWTIIKQYVLPDEPVAQTDGEGSEIRDPLPEKLKASVSARLQSDLIVCIVIAVVVFAIHISTVFTVLRPQDGYVLYILAGVLGFVVHYIMPQLRKELPWLCIAHPILKSNEYNQFEVRDAAKIMLFEKIFVWLCFIERNIIYPLVFLFALTESAKHIQSKEVFSPLGEALIVSICGLKLLRSAYSDTACQYTVLIFTVLFFKYDYINFSEGMVIDYFFMSIFMYKIRECLLKLKFVFTYIAPWQITWGSAFHAFAQPFSVPHSAMLFLQTAVSTFFSTPLNPILGSAIFFSSYIRPLKFWERDYNTKRVDHSNTRLASQLEKNPGSDDNNLNSIFYEHLTRSLQTSLYGDLALGRWGTVQAGDCYILASDYLNALVHVIELGNGLVTFQLRGLEFRGTYCQQREVEAITEGVDEDGGCCCCSPGHLPHMLSVNGAFNQRWLAWEVSAIKYVLEGYSISDNCAASMLQVFDLRKILITYYVKSIIYYVVRSPKVDQWISNEAIQEAFEPCLKKKKVPTATLR